MRTSSLITPVSNTSFRFYVPSLIELHCEQLDHSFHPSFPSTVKSIYRQLLRVFAHLYHAHFDVILHLRAEPHFNSLFAHFLAFGKEYQLLEVRDIKGEVNSPTVGVGQLWERWKERGILEG